MSNALSFLQAVERRETCKVRGQALGRDDESEPHRTFVAQRFAFDDHPVGIPQDPALAVERVIDPLVQLHISSKKFRAVEEREYGGGREGGDSLSFSRQRDGDFLVV